LVVYTNSGSDGRSEWLIERAAKEGYELNVVHLGAGELTNRIVAEKNNPVADFIFGLNAVEYEKLKKENILMKFEPVWAKEVDMSYGDKDGYYYPIVIQPLLLAYNKDIFNEQTAPKDWTDLIKPEYKDKYAIGNLSGGTPKTVLASILVRYRDPNGVYGISDEGWEIAKAYIQNAHINQSGEDYVGNAISGERPAFMIWGSGLLQNEKERNFKFGYMTPEIGAPFVVEQVAIPAKTKKADLAKEFADWFGSAEIQAEWSAQFGSTPAHPKALEKASEEVKALMNSLKVQDIDWAFVAENLDKWVEKVELEFMK